jgi:hypothetical protein
MSIRSAGAAVVFPLHNIDSKTLVARLSRTPAPVRGPETHAWVEKPTSQQIDRRNRCYREQDRQRS